MPDPVITPRAATSNWMAGLPTLEPVTAPGAPVPPAAIAPAPEPPPPNPTPPPQPSPAPDSPPKPTIPAPGEVPPGQPPVEMAAPEDAEDPWPRSAKDWKARKEKQKAKLDAAYKERDQIKGELETIRGQLEKSGDSTKLTEQLKAIQTERDQLSDTLKVIAVENHPRFKAYFEGKTNQQLDMAKRIVGAEKAEEVASLLKLDASRYRDEQLETVLAELSPLAQSQLGSVINALENIRAERASEIANAKGTYEKMLAQQAETAKSRTAKIDELFAAELKTVQDKEKGSPMFQLRDGDEAWNKSVTERINAAKNIISGKLSPEQAVTQALAAAAFPAILQHVSSLAQQLAAAQEQVKKLSAASPTVEQTPPTVTGSEHQGEAPTNVPITHKSSTTPMEATRNWIKGLQAAGQ